MNKKDRITQAWVVRAKVLRTSIRLKHAIAADIEINERVSAEYKAFWQAVHMGEILEPLSLLVESAKPDEQEKAETKPDQKKRKK